MDLQAKKNMFDMNASDTMVSEAMTCCTWEQAFEHNTAGVCFLLWQYNG